MNIQSNVNQLLSVASVLAHVNPSFRARREEEAQLKSLTRRQNRAQEMTNTIMAEREKEKGEEFKTLIGSMANIGKAPDAEILADVAEVGTRGDASDEVLKGSADETLELAKERFKLDPSQESYGAYKAAIANKEDIRGAHEKRAKSKELFEEYLASAMAQSALEREQTRIRKSRSFMDMLKDEPVSFNGIETTVGNLSKEQQEAIRKQYTKKEKTEYMNRRSKELAEKKIGGKK